MLEEISSTAVGDQVNGQSIAGKACSGLAKYLGVTFLTWEVASCNRPHYHEGQQYRQQEQRVCQVQQSVCLPGLW